MEEEEEIRTSIQCSVAMQQISCSRGPRQLFPVNEKEEEEEEVEEENKGEEEEEEEEEVVEEVEEEEEEEEEEEITTAMQSSATMQHSCTCGPWQLFFFFQ